MNTRGFSLTEVVVTVAVIAVMMTLSVPYFLTYWQTSTLRAGAEEMATVLNGARQLAIKENQTVCVTVTTAGANQGTVSYHVATCGAAAWVGPGVENDGNIRLTNNVRVSAATANVTFTYLGAAGTGGTFTVLNPTSGLALCVVVAVSGRVTISPPAVQPVCP